MIEWKPDDPMFLLDEICLRNKILAVTAKPYGVDQVLMKRDASRAFLNGIKKREVVKGLSDKLSKVCKGLGLKITYVIEERE